MKRKRYLYHVTAPENVERIIKAGLLRSASKRTAMAVYLSENPLSWYKDGLAILKIDVSGLAEIKASTFLPESDEILFWGDIPAWKSTNNGWTHRISDVTNKFCNQSRKSEGKE